jgi:serine/threonine-protein kinase RsbW
MTNDTSTLTIPNDTAYLPVVGAYVTTSALQAGFGEEDAGRIRLAVDEACTHVIETAFEPGEETTFTVTCQRSASGLRVVIADKGMPFNPAAVADYDPQAGLDRELGGLSFYLMKQVMDEVRFVGKGREGKELHLVKYLEAGNITTYFSEEELRPYEARVEPAPPGEYVFRLLQPAEAVEVARCVYKTYGYTYPGEHIYYPQRLIEMSRTGEQVSVVAISDKGEVAGYCAIFGGQADDPVRELGQAVVDPAHRGRRVLSRLLQFAIDQARARGMAGLFGEPVTNHTFSQQACIPLGFRDTALLLGYIPQSVYFKKIGEGALAQRETLLYSLLPLRAWAPAQLYPPPHHRAMLARIYENLGIARELAQAGRGASADEKNSLGPVSDRAHSLGPVSDRAHSLGPVSDRAHSLGPVSNRAHSLGPVSDRARPGARPGSVGDRPEQERAHSLGPVSLARWPGRADRARPGARPGSVGDRPEQERAHSLGPVSLARRPGRADRARPGERGGSVGDRPQQVGDRPEQVGDRPEQERIFRTGPGGLALQRPEQSVLSTRVLSAINVARIEIATYGQHVTTEVEIKLNELCRKGIACIHLDLPLGDPWTAHLCADFEALGFLLAGVLPDPRGQDVLRLQFLNGVPIDFDKIHVASDVGQELLGYIRRMADS